MDRNLDYESAPWSHTFPIVGLGVRDRPVILLGPFSYLGGIYGPMIVEKCRNVVAVVDDQYRDAKIHGVYRWTSDEFRSRAPGIPGLLGVDLAGSPMGYAMFGRLLLDTGVERADLVSVLAELDLPAVYQTPLDMRARTIVRQAEWAQFRKALADEMSRVTLDAILLLRLTCDRKCLWGALTSPEDEYFSMYASSATFRLRADEIFCDAGAYIGSTARKVIAASGGTFRAIHAFEPDRASYRQLSDLSALRLPGIVCHNTAVGDYTGTVRFLETGTMGSHVDEATGNSGDTAITRLDDAIDDVTFIKMDLEGFEQRALLGAARLIRTRRPRMAITGYHYADDLLDLWRLLADLAPGYSLRLRHHSSYYYDSIIYANSAMTDGHDP